MTAPAYIPPNSPSRSSHSLTLWPHRCAAPTAASPRPPLLPAAACRSCSLSNRCSRRAMPLLGSGPAPPAGPSPSADGVGGSSPSANRAWTAAAAAAAQLGYAVRQELWRWASLRPAVAAHLFATPPAVPPKALLNWCQRPARAPTQPPPTHLGSPAAWPGQPPARTGPAAHRRPSAPLAPPRRLP